MTEEKKSRLVASTTVVCVLFLFILVVVLVYQTVTYSAIRKQKAALEAQKAALQQQITSQEQEIESRKTAWQAELLARKYGLKFPDETRFTGEED